MTISDYLKRRVRLLSLALFAVWLCIPVSFSVFGAKAMDRAPPWPVIVFFPMFGLVMLFLARTRCPRCKGPLYGLTGNIAFRSFRKHRVRYCPYCRADFDEPLDDGAGANPKRAGDSRIS